MKKSVVSVCLFLFGLGIISAIFGLIGFDKIWTNLQKVGGWGLVFYIGVTLISLGLTGLAWWLSLRSYQVRISALHTVIGHLIGFGMNLLIPSLYLGGEPFRAYYIGKIYHIPKNDVFATAIFAKFIELLAFLAFLYLGILVLLFHPKFAQLIPAEVDYTLMAIGLVLGVVFILFFWGIVKNIQLITRFFCLFRKAGILNRWLDKVISEVRQMEEVTSLVFRHNWKIGLVVMLCSLVSVGITFAKPALIFYFLLEPPRILSLAELALIFTVGQILFSFHLTPGGLGFLEGGQMVTFKYINIQPEVAAAYLIIARLIDFLMAGLGGYLMVRFGLTRLTEQKDNTESLTSQEGG